MKKSLVKLLSCYLVVAVIFIGIVQRVYAGFSPSEAMPLTSFDRSSDLEKIQKVLELKMVQERLKQFGYTPDEIYTRLGQLNDQQLHELALQLDDLQVGGDGAGWVIALVLVAILVVLILYLSGHRLILKRE